MAYSKVIVNSTTIMDVTQDTVTASSLFKNITATKADGTKATGTVETVAQATPVATIANATGIISATATQSAGVVVAGTKTGTAQLTVQAGKTVTPTESTQTAVASYRWTTGTITVAAISSTYVGSGIATKSSADLVLDGRTFTAPAGFYAEDATKSMTQYDLTAPSVSIANATGIITATASIPSNKIGYYTSQNASNTLSLTTQVGTTITPTATTQTAVASYRWTTGTVTVAAVPIDTSSTLTTNGTHSAASGKFWSSVTVSIPATTASLQTKTETYTPSTATQTATISADTGYDGLSQVTVKINPMPSGTAGTPSAVQGSVSNNRITIIPTVTNTAGYIAGGTITGTAVTISASSLVSGTYSVSASGNHNVTNYATASVPAGTAGTPVATKGTVSNHAISVAPTVTNTTGWITGGTKNGTAITVSVSELVSGTLTITENGTVDVTNYASATISVEGGGSGGSSIQIATKTVTLASAASSIQFTGLSGNPTSFVVTSQEDIATNTNGVAGVVFDGSALHGQTITSQVEADTGFTKSYSSGTLTITATSAQFRPNTYKLVYTYGGSSSDIHTADIQVGSGATSITFPVNGRPAYWSCIFKSDFSTSSGYQRVIVVVNDSSSIYGLEMDSSAHAATSWSATYNGGNLTISSQGTNNGGYFHQPGYYQLTYYVDESAPQYQARTVTPSTATQTVLPESGYDALSQVTVNPIPSNYIVPTGNITISANGTNINVAQYSTATVSVPTGGGSSKNIQVCTATANYVANTTYTAVSGQTLTVSATGTYDILWVAWRSSTSSTTYYGTQLYIDNTAHGSANTTWTGTGGQQNHLTNVSLSQGDVLTVRARSRGSNYRTYVSNLTIIEQ